MNSLSRITAVIGALVVSLVLSFSVVAADDKVDAATALNMVQNGQAVLVDIRRPSEWASTGIPAPAKPISMHSDQFFDEILALSKANPGKRIALICAGGVRSAAMQSKLSELGLSSVIDVTEGVLGNGGKPGWLARGLPVKTYGQ